MKGGSSRRRRDITAEVERPNDTSSCRKWRRKQSDGDEEEGAGAGGGGEDRHPEGRILETFMNQSIHREIIGFEGKERL